MIGDAAKILNAVRATETLRRAFRYALHDRWRNYYYDPFELEDIAASEDAVVAELVAELRKPQKYKPRPAYAFYPPKNEFCYRRMIYIPFEDLVVRYALALVVSDLLDSDLSERCFANRRATGEAAAETLLQDYAAVSWPAFCSWQRACAKQPERFSTLLRTDICWRARQRAQISRRLGRLRAYALIAKIPHSRRWKVSVAGYRLMSASLRLREHDFPLHHAAAS